MSTDLLSRHLHTCEELLSGPGGRSLCETASKEIQSLVSEFQRIANGIAMLGERPPRSVDEALAIGERLSSTLLAFYLQSIGARAQAVNAAEVVVTDAVFGNASPHMEATRLQCEAKLVPLIVQGVAPVVTGYNGATADGRPTTLGRGGSDFSASILASALDAQGTLDLDRCRRHHDGGSAAGRQRGGFARGHVR